LTLTGSADTNGIASVAYEKSTNGGTTWTSTAASQSGVADGDYRSEERRVGKEGRAWTSNAIEVKIDTTAPVAGALSLTNLTDPGTHNTPPLTSALPIYLTLTGSADTNGIASVAYEKSTNGGTTWTSTAASQSGVADGDY